jgi:transketolase
MKPTHKMRAEILKAVHTTGLGLMPSAFSELEILYAIHRILKPDDELVISKGHGVLAWYALTGQLENYAQGKLPALGPNGSLGHGLAQAVGQALSRKAGRVFCLVGDGEAQEGAIWEAARIIGERKLPVTVIIDANGSHDETTARAMFTAANLTVYTVDGHDTALLMSAFASYPSPCVFIADTIKGYPFERMINDPGAWHNRAPDETELAELLAELEWIP